MSTSDAVSVASAVFAAIAAGGSALAALVMLHQWTAQTTPALSVDVAEVCPKRTLYLTIVNYGGPIKKVSFAAVEGTQACISFLPPRNYSDEALQNLIARTAEAVATLRHEG